MKNALSKFFDLIREDNRIGTSHVSLYMAMFELWNQNNCQGPVSITRQKLMISSKISGVATYHKCIRDLNDYGYIRYEPSYNPSVQSRVNLIFDNILA